MFDDIRRPAWQPPYAGKSISVIIPSPAGIIAAAPITDAGHHPTTITPGRRKSVMQTMDGRVWEVPRTEAPYRSASPGRYFGALRAGSPTYTSGPAHPCVTVDPRHCPPGMKQTCDPVVIGAWRSAE